VSRGDLISAQLIWGPELSGEKRLRQLKPCKTLCKPKTQQAAAWGELSPTLLGSFCFGYRRQLAMCLTVSVQFRYMSAPVATDSSKNLPMPPQNAASFSDHVHQRTQRRKNNPWNLLLALFCLIGVVGTWIGLVRLLLGYRGSLIPSDAFLFSGTRTGNILMFVTPLFVSIAVGFIVGNLLIWCIAPARSAFNREAAGVKGEDLQSAQLGLAKVGMVVLMVALPICLSAQTIIGRSRRVASTTDPCSRRQRSTMRGQA
jgi:hypothetical protein